MRKRIAGLFLAWVVLAGCLIPAATAAEAGAREAKGAASPPSIQKVIEHVFHLKEGDPPTTLWFFGRLHPVLVHVPIGLLIGLFLMELWAALLGAEEFQRAAVFLAALATLGSLAAAVTGLLLSLRAEYDPVLLFRHTWLGFAVFVLAGLVWFGRSLYSRTGDLGVGAIYYLTLLATVGVLGIGSYFGIQLTHGNGYLTQYLPASIVSLWAPSEDGLDQTMPAVPTPDAPSSRIEESSTSSAPEPPKGGVAAELPDIPSPAAQP
jgi:uncharacterized membrane protein